MIIYSVTVSLEHEIEEEWLEWMHGQHIQDVMNTGYFEAYRFHKILEPVVDPERVSYNVLYSVSSRQKLDEYNREAASRLQLEHQERFGDQALAIRVVLEQLKSSESV